MYVAPAKPPVVPVTSTLPSVDTGVVKSVPVAPPVIATAAAIVYGAVSEQLFSSVTVNTPSPDARSLTLAEFVEPVDHEYVYAPVPPLTVAVATPSDTPSQVTPSTGVTLTFNAVGSVIVTDALAEQRLSSLTVIVYVPAVKPDGSATDS